MAKTEIPPIAIDLDGGTDIGAAIVDADLFLIDDGAGGTMRKTAASRLKTYIGSGLSNADYWYKTADQTVASATLTTITGWANKTNNLAGGNELGAVMAVSSGLFTFPATGIWYVAVRARIVLDGSSRYNNFYISTTTDDASNYVNEALGSSAITRSESAATTVDSQTYALLDIQNASEDKVRFQLQPSAEVNVNGDGTYSNVAAIFLKLGDT